MIYLSSTFIWGLWLLGTIDLRDADGSTGNSLFKICIITYSLLGPLSAYLQYQISACRIKRLLAGKTGMDITVITTSERLKKFITLFNSTHIPNDDNLMRLKGVRLYRFRSK